MSQQINLYGTAFRKQTGPVLSATTMAAVFGLVILLVAGQYAVGRWQGDELAARAAEAESRLRAEQDKAKKIAEEIAAQKKDPVLEAEVARLEGLARVRRESLEVLKGGVIGNTLGYSEFMRALARQTVDGLWLTGFSVAQGGNDVALNGRMVDPELLPRYLGRLKKESALNGRPFAGLQIQRPGGERATKAADGRPPPYLEFTLAAVGDPVARDAGVGLAAAPAPAPAPAPAGGAPR